MRGMCVHGYRLTEYCHPCSKQKEQTMKTKKRLIKEAIIAYPANTDRQIADRVKCHPSYVALVRKSLGLVYDEAAEITEAKAKPITLDELKKDVMERYETKVKAATGVDAILNERGSRYGSFVGHAGVTQAYKDFTALELRNRDKTLAPDQQEALDMIFHKIGRIINGDPDYADSWIDIAGYAKLVADRLEGRER